MRLVKGDFSYYLQFNSKGPNGYRPVLSFDLTSWSLGGLEFERHEDGKYERVVLRFLCVVLYINRFTNY
jgi:hypothetical protein